MRKRKLIQEVLLIDEVYMFDLERFSILNRKIEFPYEICRNCFFKKCNGIICIKLKSFPKKEEIKINWVIKKNLFLEYFTKLKESIH
jgi:DNA helicase TIP49 (TBP-interacting protein)